MITTQANDVTLIVEGDPRFKPITPCASGIYNCPRCGERIFVDDQHGWYEFDRIWGIWAFSAETVKPGRRYQLRRTGVALECSTCGGTQWRFEG